MFSLFYYKLRVYVVALDTRRLFISSFFFYPRAKEVVVGSSLINVLPTFLRTCAMCCPNASHRMGCVVQAATVFFCLLSLLSFFLYAIGARITGVKCLYLTSRPLPFPFFSPPPSAFFLSRWVNVHFLFFPLVCLLGECARG